MLPQGSISCDTIYEENIIFFTVSQSYIGLHRLSQSTFYLMNLTFQTGLFRPFIMEPPVLRAPSHAHCKKDSWNRQQITHVDLKGCT